MPGSSLYSTSKSDTAAGGAAGGGVVWGGGKEAGGQVGKAAQGAGAGTERRSNQTQLRWPSPGDSARRGTGRGAGRGQGAGTERSLHPPTAGRPLYGSPAPPTCTPAPCMPTQRSAWWGKRVVPPPPPPHPHPPTHPPTHPPSPPPTPRPTGAPPTRLQPGRPVDEVGAAVDQPLVMQPHKRLQHRLCRKRRSTGEHRAPVSPAGAAAAAAEEEEEVQEEGEGWTGRATPVTCPAPTHRSGRCPG